MTPADATRGRLTRGDSGGATDDGAKPEEIVQLVDSDGLACGLASRSRVRRDNLRHAATAVLVRHGDGRIYVHRRTEVKDWAPGHWDAAAGGLMRVGEDPTESAKRELAEELGITGTALSPLLTCLYEDDTTRCFEHVYQAHWSGHVHQQPEEVSEGRWMSLPELADLLADPSQPFVPDTRQVLRLLANQGIGDYGVLDQEAGCPWQVDVAPQ